MRRTHVLTILLLALGAFWRPGAADPALAAESAAAMTQDVLDSLTKGPASGREAAHSGAARAGNTGPAAPVAPSAPTAPTVPGASPLPGARTPGLSTSTPGLSANTVGQGRAISLKHDGVERRAIIVAPRNVQASGPKDKPQRKLPVVIFLHGAGGSAAQAMTHRGRMASVSNTMR